MAELTPVEPSATRSLMDRLTPVELAALMEVWCPGDLERRGRELEEHGVPTNEDLQSITDALMSFADGRVLTREDAREYWALRARAAANTPRVMLTLPAACR